MSGILERIDCHSIPVPDLDLGIEFYSSLGQELIWRSETAAGLRLPDSDTELVLHTDNRPIETDFKVESVPDAVEQFIAAGGRLVHGPFDIQIGQCAVLLDPWDNPIIVLDTSKGLLRVDENKNVIGNDA